MPLRARARGAPPATIAVSTCLAVLLLAPCAEARWRNDSDPFLVAPHVAIGFGASSPYVFGQIGLRLSERHLLIGIELSSLLQAGFAADAIIYFVKLRRVAVHVIDPGIGWNAFGHYLSTPEVTRSIDLRLGAGVELRVCRRAYLTMDWKVSLPDPGFVITHYGDYGKSIFLEALKDSQLWLGVLIH
jgi:hypothetical protein